MGFAEDAIWQYIHQLTDVSADWRSEEFKHRSYERWAATEILGQIINHPEKKPTNVIESFWVLMELYAFTAKDIDQKFMFETGMQTAEDLMMLFV